MKSFISALTAIALAAGMLSQLTGCSKPADEPTAETPALTTPVPAGMVSGTVLETMDSGGYTYVLLETDREQRWLAGPQTAIQVGDELRVSQGMPMQQFTSNTLNRTFEVLYFVDALGNLTTPAMPAGHPSFSGTDEAPAMDTKVAELEPGQNIAWLHANKDTVAGQQVSLRGKVVKYNSNIMDRNFIHIQDGSGDAADGSNDLTVTSKTETAVGQTIVVSGTIILDKEFGAGYSFPVMMEDASISAE